MGASAGLIPCPSALVVLLGAVAQHELALGLVMIVAFSLGLAATLTALGIAVVRARGCRCPAAWPPCCRPRRVRDRRRGRRAHRSRPRGNSHDPISRPLRREGRPRRAGAARPEEEPLHVLLALRGATAPAHARRRARSPPCARAAHLDGPPAGRRRAVRRRPARDRRGARPARGRRPRSVYRNLEALEAAGLARHVHLGHAAGLYVLSGRHDGGYAACERCGRTCRATTSRRCGAPSATSRLRVRLRALPARGRLPGLRGDR